MISKIDTDIIVSELNNLAKKDLKRAIKVERKIAEMIKIHPEIIKKRKSVKGLVKEVYEDLRMRDDLNKKNTKKVDSSFLKKTSRIGRINRKKAWHQLLYYIKKNLYRLNLKELNHRIAEIEKNIILPEDYDILQTAKLRDEFVFLKNRKLNFHTIENSKDTIKRILLKDNSIIILGRNIVYRINVETKEIESDKPNNISLLPIDMILYISGGFVFVWLS